jgi:hypothetical protein
MFEHDSDWSLPELYFDLPKVKPININNHKAIWITTAHPNRQDRTFKDEDEANFIRYGKLISELWKTKQFQQ